MSRLKKDLGVLLLDILAVNLAYFLALAFRAEVSDAGNLFAQTYNFTLYLNHFLRFAPIYTVLCIVVFYLFHLYGGVWKFAGRNTAYNVVLSWIVTTVIQIVGSLLMMAAASYPVHRMPLTYYIVGAALQLLFVTVIRFARRFASIEKRRREKKRGKAIVVGAGAMGMLAMQTVQDGENFDVCAVVDTQKENVGLLVDGVPVYGLETLDALLEKNEISCVFLAEPDLSAADRAKIVLACTQRKIVLRERTDKTEGTVKEEQFVATTEVDSEWAEEYKKQFGEDPSFF